MRPLAVYVHIPFCTVKCGYCDFNAYAGLHHLAERYHRSLLAEIGGYQELLESARIETVYFGGGTPSEVPARHIAAVLEALSPPVPTAEVSLEANPGTISLAQLRDLRAAGVTRLSLGAQSFHASELRFLDRIHSAEATVAVAGLAREAGFESLSLDLIYGLPGQSLAAWQESLAAALALGPNHLSLYALTVEEGTPLARRMARGEVTALDDDAVAAMYEAASAELGAAGFRQYELSSWARPGHQSRHNRAYWTDGEFLGLGAGAHGYLGGERYHNRAQPGDYIEALEAGGSAVQARELPDRARAMSDWLMLRLRLVEGFSLSEFEQRFGQPLASLAGEALQRCLAAGLLEDVDTLRLTSRGRLLHGEVTAELVACLKSSLEKPAFAAPLLPP